MTLRPYAPVMRDVVRVVVEPRGFFALIRREPRRVRVYLSCGHVKELDAIREGTRQLGCYRCCVGPAR